MTTIAFRANESMKQELEHLAKRKGINLSALIKMYLTEVSRRDLNQITENGMTVAEELEILMAIEEGGDGKVYDSAEEYIKSL